MCSQQRGQKTAAEAASRLFVLDLFDNEDYFPVMTRSTALQKPAPEADGPAADDLLGTGVDRERRRGRGVNSNASGRYEATARIAFDDGWRSIEDLPPFETTVTVDTTRKIITRNEFAGYLLRPLDQSLSRLRARLRLLLRAADTRLSRAVAGARLRIEAVRETRGAGTAGARTSAPNYVPRTMAIGTNTDPYQPIERRYQVMRRIL